MPSSDRDDEHQAADPDDVVACRLFDDALVDDVGVEVGQVQVADGLDEQQAEDDGDPAAVRREVGRRSAITSSASPPAPDADRYMSGDPLAARSTIRRHLGAARARPKPDEAGLSCSSSVARGASPQQPAGAASISLEDGLAGVGRVDEDDPPVRRVVPALDEAALPPSGRRCRSCWRPRRRAHPRAGSSARPVPSRTVRTLRWMRLSEPCSSAGTADELAWIPGPQHIDNRVAHLLAGRRYSISH